MYKSVEKSPELATVSESEISLFPLLYGARGRCRKEKDKYLFIKFARVLQNEERRQCDPRTLDWISKILNVIEVVQNVGAK